ncbi:hypothetical protein EB796_018885 [Bugula neritina]|uniref:Uncharacterized protein n=1 Tax=Bugula neritina TaxID=10212 RepID=A0A7J7JBR6_BUGNE|nr:hypothetical protein EB796_018885 [Bugula neritina]
MHVCLKCLYLSHPNKLYKFHPGNLSLQLPTTVKSMYCMERLVQVFDINYVVLSVWRYDYYGLSGRRHAWLLVTAQVSQPVCMVTEYTDNGWIIPFKSRVLHWRLCWFLVKVDTV